LAFLEDATLRADDTRVSISTDMAAALTGIVMRISARRDCGSP